MTHTNVAIVTGGSAGIGAEICRSMLDAGYEVISMARRAADFSHPRLHNMQVDLLDATATAQAGAEAASRFPISHVIHNAGVIWPNLLPQVTQEELHGLTQIHLGAAISLVQAALPGMQERKFGRIVMMSSRGALGLPTCTAYSATKAGMVGMARTWSLELAPYGITVNVVAPRSDPDRHVLRGDRTRQRTREAAGRRHPGQAPGPLGRRGAGRHVLRGSGQQLRHRADAVRLRRRQRQLHHHLSAHSRGAASGFDG